MANMADKMVFRFLSDDFEKERGITDNNVTHSSHEQEKVEKTIAEHFADFKNKLQIDVGGPELQRSKHGAFLIKGLKHLSESYEALDASQPWLCYWILHSLELLDIPISEDQAVKVAEYLGKCQCENGGFGGGPDQLAHLAPTYAAVNALCILGTITDKAYSIINRETMYKFIMSRRTDEGAFTMHEGGEDDIRGAYCAASVAQLINISTEEMFEGTAEWIVRYVNKNRGFYV